MQEYLALFFFPVCFLCYAGWGAYGRAELFRKQYEDSYYNGIIEIGSIKENDKFWYLTNTPKGMEFFLIDIDAKKTIPAFDQKQLSRLLSPYLGNREPDPYKLPFRQITYNISMDTVTFQLESFNYKLSLKDYSLTRHKVRDSQRNYYWGSVFRENHGLPIKSPDGKNEAYISEGNLWVKDLTTNESRRLSDDGSVYEYYSSNIYWSPDSKKIVCCKYRPGGDRKLFIVSSSPKNKLQPETLTYDYPKPGDALPIRRPVLFLVDEGEKITFDIPNVTEQYDLGSIKWDEGSQFFTFHFNRRGHQQYIIYSGNISGKLFPVVNERADTFIFYSNLYTYWFENSNDLLWISERDGWRHLYLYDVLTGNVKKQLTWELGC